MRKTAAAALAAFLLSASPSHAREGCLPLPVFETLLNAQGLAYERLNPDRTARFVALSEQFSIAPEPWDIVVLAVDADGEVFAALGLDGEICARINLPFEAVRVVLRAVYGWRV